ncbi:WXG100 family type VII secretion target [Mycobacterium sp. pUA109]|uniref:WXG100 family type VII secretion target n=1 Tax=Mycobacterium sp. pUA109 TaxID=3238982 RepID=UPI00351B6C65
MTEPLHVKPDDLRATSRDLADVSSRLKAVMSSLQGKLSGEGAAWGNDKIGDQFANGGNGYLAQVNWVQGSIDAKTDLLDSYAEGLKNTADTFEDV